MIYYFIGFILTINYLYSESKFPKFMSHLSLLKYETIILVLFAGLRSITVGTDTLTYCRIFESIANGGAFGEGERFEIGYKLFVRLIASISSNPHVFIFVSAVVVYVGLYLFLKNNSDSPVFSILLFYLIFFCNSLNISRQYVGLAIAINSLTYIKSKKYVKALLLILIGTTIHTACIILLVVLIISFFKQNYKWMIAMVILSVLSVIFYKNILQIIIRFFPAYSFYFTYSFFEGDGRVGRLTILMILLLVWNIVKYRKRYVEYYRTGKGFDEVSDTILISETMILACSIGILASQFVMLDRISEILNIFVVLMIPQMTEGKYKKLCEIGLIAVFFFYMYIVINYGGIGVEPYSFLN